MYRIVCQEPEASGEPFADILLTGDFCPRGVFEEKLLKGEPILDKGIFDLVQGADLAVTNLEMPLVDPARRDPKGHMGGRPEVAPWLKAFGFDVACLANNHIRDQGDQGVLETIRNVEASGLRATGAGANSNEADRMLVVEVKGLRIGIWNISQRELNIAGATSAGAALFNPDANVALIPELRKQVDYLLLYVHAGHEFMTVPSPVFRDAYRRFIDAGADIVVAHHPHVAQGLEEYHGRWIFYSLGNFLFYPPRFNRGGGEGTDWGLLLQLRIGRHRTLGATLYPTLDDPSCFVHLMDDVAGRATEKKLCIMSENARDDVKLMKEWEHTVAEQFVDEWLANFMAFPQRIRDPQDHVFKKIMQNTFTCPVATEFLEQAFRMVREGRIVIPPPQG